MAGSLQNDGNRRDGGRTPPAPGSALIFDRGLVRGHRDRAAARFHDHDFLFAEVAAGLIDRLRDVKRRFRRVLDLGCHTGGLGRLLMAADAPPDLLVEADLSAGMVARAGGGARLAADEEFLPFAPNSFDLVISCLSLHWVNDLPGALIQINRCLSPDGLFLGALFGAGTLDELRRALTQADLATRGGAGLRVSPFLDLRDGGALLQRAGFALPVADVDTITVTYAEPLTLMADLRGMGETNTLIQRARQPLTRATLGATAAAYAEHFTNPEGRLPATFQVVTLTGWHPDKSQPQPAKRGSATASLAEALERK